MLRGLRRRYRTPFAGLAEFTGALFWRGAIRGTSPEGAMAILVADALPNPVLFLDVFQLFSRHFHLSATRAATRGFSVSNN
jgi:hypothetical protein